MNIRLAKGEDLPLLNDIERVCFTSERFPLDVLRAMLREKGFLTLIAEEAGTGVAYATMFHKDRRARAQLASIAVLPEHRKKGSPPHYCTASRTLPTRRERSSLPWK